jgi:peptidoglycan/LPS O-acetylase OafA/YrhL
MDSQNSLKRFDGVDVLRGVSIVAVVLFHINLHMSLNDVAFHKALPVQLARTLFWNGANGVTVFFAISGFLITTMTIRRWQSSNAIDIKAFYELRFARIAPLLLALLVVLSFFHLCGLEDFVIAPERASLGRALLAAVTFHINWLESVRGYLPGSWDVLWSLSVEEVFYLFFPLISRYSKSRTILAAVLLVFVAIGPFARTVLTKNEFWADRGYLSCMDAIALGCLSAMLVGSLQLSRFSAKAIQFVGAALIVLVMAARPLVSVLHLYNLGLDVTVLALGTCLVMIAMAHTDSPGGKRTAILRWFGRNSYEVYLTHAFVVLWSVRLFVALKISQLWAPVWYLGVLALSGLLGATVARWYSEPLNRKLRQKIARRLPPAISQA